MIIFEMIKNLITKEEMNALIKYRLSTLDTQKESEIGAGTNLTVFNNYVNKNTIVNASCELVLDEDTALIKDVFYGRVIFDDDRIYKYLIESVKQNDNPYDAVFQAAIKYSPRPESSEDASNKLEFRSITYTKLSGRINKTLSIKLFHFTNTMACTENAAIVHNMFLFLGIESDYVICGETLSNPHSFNVIYPEGRDKYAVVYDASVSTGEHPIMFLLDDERRQKLFLNEKISVSREDVSMAYKKLLGSDYEFKILNDSYSIFKDTSPIAMIEYAKSKVKKNRLELLKDK